MKWRDSEQTPLSHHPITPSPHHPITPPPRLPSLPVSLIPKEPEKPAGKEARQTYLVFARAVIGEISVDYPTLYQRFAQNDWAAIKLDEAVALTGLRAGYPVKEVVGFLHQSPYVQHQIHGQQIPVATMTQYAKATVQKALQTLGQPSEIPIQSQPGTGATPKSPQRDRPSRQEL